MAKQELVECSFGLSPQCRGTYMACSRDVRLSREAKGGKVACTKCHHILQKGRKLSNKAWLVGRRNPNTRHVDLNDGFFQKIDTEFKAWCLGWIASDGSIRPGTTTINICDRSILETIRNELCFSLEIKPRNYKTNAGEIRTLYGLAINSQEISRDLCGWLKIHLGKKSHVVQVPDLAPDLLRHFFRGLFEGDGTVTKPKGKKKSPYCSITTNSSLLREGIVKHSPSLCKNDKKNCTVAWAGNHAIDFLGWIYDGASEKLTLSRKKQRYETWATWVPSILGSYGKMAEFRWNRTDARAVAPFKARASDSGYDLTLIEEVSRIGQVVMFDTGVKVMPEFGWWFGLVPRSSMIKTGYILANSFGVIDRTYMGTVKVPLIKIDPNAPELALPARIVQLIPIPAIHMRLIENSEDGPTPEVGRGKHGFGESTGL